MVAISRYRFFVRTLRHLLCSASALRLRLAFISLLAIHVPVSTVSKLQTGIICLTAHQPHYVFFKAVLPCFLFVYSFFTLSAHVQTVVPGRQESWKVLHFDAFEITPCVPRV